MSTLIKGLRIPPIGVRDCVIAFKDNYLLITDSCGKTIFEGEYVEIPTPHGRLIDADTIDYPLDWQGEIVKAVINQTPTVIEAEVE